MKEFKKYINLRVVLSVVFLIYISWWTLKGGMNLGDDTSFHLLRINEIYDNLRHGHILPTIYANSLDGYGYANSFFYPDLFLYIPALLMFLNISVVTAYKVLLLITTVVTMIITYYTTYKVFKSKNIAFLNMIGYTGCIYRVNNIQLRGALAETIAMAFIPLILYGAYKIVNEGSSDYSKRNNIHIPLVLGFVLMFYAHLISTFIMFLAIFIYFLFNIKKIFKEKRYMEILNSTFLCISLTSPFLFPMLYMMAKGKYKFNETLTFSLDSKLVHILSTLNIEVNDVALFILWIFIILAVGFLLKYIFNKYNYSELKRNSVVMLLLGCFISISTTDLIPWRLISKIFPPIALIQFPFRLLSLGLFLLILANIVIMDNIINNFYVELFILSLTMVVLNYNVINYYPSKVSNNFTPNVYSIGEGEYLPKGFKYPYNEPMKNTVIGENDKVEVIYDNKNLRQREITFKSDDKNQEIKLPYTYYDGYKVTINNKKTEPFKTEEGFLAVKLEDTHEGTIKVEYKQPIIRYISILIFVVALFIIYKYDFKRKE